mmetsp:Transcript_6644/g.8609  ORF Transcript_6644/g.8609 Transcript_6644/m.8609 type:complete len:201 (+) Transcript_6644:82-684(+)
MDIEKKLQKRYSRILSQESRVLEQRDAVSQLREQQSDQTNSDRTSNKLTGWRKLYAIQKNIDKANRTSDQKFNARIYSKVDEDIWSATETRAWYQKYAVPIPRETVDPIASGFMKAEVSLSQNQDHLYKLKSQHEFAPHVPPKPTKPGPHFLNHEGNLREQSINNDRYLKEQPNFPQPVIGDVERVVGFRRAPWKDRADG